MYSINSFFVINKQIHSINKKRMEIKLNHKDDHWIQIKYKQRNLNKMWNSGNSKLFNFLNCYYDLQDECNNYVEKYNIKNFEEL
tara:strand:- start:687 stop:938 length:252 start_codon:yes stop_codon:yes gene_type:complete